MQVFRYIRKCQEICENHARKKSLPQANDVSAVSPALLQVRDGSRPAPSLTSKLTRSASDFGKEGLQYLSSYLGGLVFSHETR